MGLSSCWSQSSRHVQWTKREPKSGKYIQIKVHYITALVRMTKSMHILEYSYCWVGINLK